MTFSAHPVQRANNPPLTDHRSQGVAIKGVAVQGLGVQHKLPAFELGGRGRHRHLTGELVWGPGFSLADALDLGGVQRIDLAAALPVILNGIFVSAFAFVGIMLAWADFYSRGGPKPKSRDFSTAEESPRHLSDERRAA